MEISLPIIIAIIIEIGTTSCIQENIIYFQENIFSWIQLVVPIKVGFSFS